MKSAVLPFLINGLGDEQIMAYHKPLIGQLAFKIKFDWQYVDIFSEVSIFV